MANRPRDIKGTFDPDRYNEVDMAAFHLAIEMTLGEADPSRVQQMDSMLADKTRPWLETARFASYHQQCRLLRLEPWQCPPMSLYPDDPEYLAVRGPIGGLHVTREGVRLLRRLLAAGLSRYEPDPVGALREVEEGEAEED